MPIYYKGKEVELPRVFKISQGDNIIWQNGWAAIIKFIDPTHLNKITYKIGNKPEQTIDITSSIISISNIKMTETIEFWVSEVEEGYTYSDLDHHTLQFQNEEYLYTEVVGRITWSYTLERGLGIKSITYSTDSGTTWTTFTEDTKVIYNIDYNSTLQFKAYEAERSNFILSTDIVEKTYADKGGSSIIKAIKWTYGIYFPLYGIITAILYKDSSETAYHSVEWKSSAWPEIDIDNTLQICVYTSKTSTDDYYIPDGEGWVERAAWPGSFDKEILPTTLKDSSITPSATYYRWTLKATLNKNNIIKVGYKKYDLATETYSDYTYITDDFTLQTTSQYEYLFDYFEVVEGASIPDAIRATAKNRTIAIEASVSAYSLTFTNTNSAMTVERLTSPIKGATLGQLTSGSKIYYMDTILVTPVAASYYKNPVCTLAGGTYETFTEPTEFTVTKSLYFTCSSTVIPRKLTLDLLGCTVKYTLNGKTNYVYSTQTIDWSGYSGISYEVVSVSTGYKWGSLPTAAQVIFNESSRPEEETVELHAEVKTWSAWAHFNSGEHNITKISYKLAASELWQDRDIEPLVASIILDTAVSYFDTIQVKISGCEEGYKYTDTIYELTNSNDSVWLPNASRLTWGCTVSMGTGLTSWEYSINDGATWGEKTNNFTISGIDYAATLCLRQKSTSRGYIADTTIITKSYSEASQTITLEPITLTAYTLFIDKSAFNGTISVKLNGETELQTDATVYDTEKLISTATASTGYEISSYKCNGIDYIAGTEITVSSDVSFVIESTMRTWSMKVTKGDNIASYGYILNGTEVTGLTDLEYTINNIPYDKSIQITAVTPTSEIYNYSTPTGIGSFSWNTSHETALSSVQTVKTFIISFNTANTWEGNSGRAYISSSYLNIYRESSPYQGATTGLFYKCYHASAISAAPTAYYGDTFRLELVNTSDRTMKVNNGVSTFTITADKEISWDTYLSFTASISPEGYGTISPTKSSVEFIQRTYADISFTNKTVNIYTGASSNLFTITPATDKYWNYSINYIKINGTSYSADKTELRLTKSDTIEASMRRDLAAYKYLYVTTNHCTVTVNRIASPAGLSIGIIATISGDYSTTPYSCLTAEDDILTISVVMDEEYILEHIKLDGVEIQQGTEINMTANRNLVIEYKGELPEGNFATDTWAEIQTEAKRLAAAYDATGNIPKSKYKLGDERTETINGATAKIKVIGYCHDTPTDTSIYGYSKAGLTLQFYNTIPTKPVTCYPSYANDGGWDSSNIKICAADYYALMPTSITDVVVPVNKLCSSGGSSTTPTLYTSTNNTLFVLSLVEYLGINTYKYNATDYALEEGSQYAHYATANIGLYSTLCPLSRYLETGELTPVQEGDTGTYCEKRSESDISNWMNENWKALDSYSQRQDCWTRSPRVGSNVSQFYIKADRTTNTGSTYSSNKKYIVCAFCV